MWGTASGGLMTHSSSLSSATISKSSKAAQPTEKKPKWIQILSKIHRIMYTLDSSSLSSANSWISSKAAQPTEIDTNWLKSIDEMYWSKADQHTEIGYKLIKDRLTNFHSWYIKFRLSFKRFSRLWCGSCSKILKWSLLHRSRTATGMEGTLPTDLWKFETSRDNQKIISTSFQHLKKCINFQN